MDKNLVHRIALGEAEPFELESVGIDEVFAIKSDGELTHRRFYAEKAAGVDTERRRVSGVVMSTESTDRMGDVIQVSGWSLDNFKANPQLLWAHDSHALPIGTPVKVRSGRTSKGLRALMSDEEFHTIDENPHAELVFRLVAKGALPGRSVGFRGLDVHRPADDQEREKLKLGRYGVLYRASELLENSVVPIPANQYALQEKALGVAREVYDSGCDDIPREVVKAVFESIAFTEQDAERIARAIRRRSVMVPDLSDIASQIKITVGDEEIEPDIVEVETAKAERAADVTATALSDALEAFRVTAKALDEELAKVGLTRADVRADDPTDVSRSFGDALARINEANEVAMRGFTDALDAFTTATRSSSEDVADAIDQLKNHLTETATEKRESANGADPVGEAATPEIAAIAEAIKSLAFPAPKRTAITE